MQEIKNIVFDLDGTLIDSSEGIYYSYLDAIKASGLSIKPINFNNFRSKIGPPFEIMCKLIHNNLNEDNLRLLVSKFRYIYDFDGFKTYKIYNNIYQLIKYLHKSGHKLYILSNKREIPLKEIIKKDFPDYFIKVWGRNNKYFSKSKILKDLVKKDTNGKFLFIGDTINDKKAAEEAGVEFIFVSYGYGMIEKDKEIIICSQPEDLKELINKI